MSNIMAPLGMKLIGRTIKNVNPLAIVKFSSNYAYQHSQFHRQNRTGAMSPTFMHLEITTRCTKNCKGCYVPLNERRQEDVMDVGTARKAVAFGKKIGVRNYNFMGGETVTRATLPLIETIVRENPWLSFYCCTNACLLSSQAHYLDSLVRQSNMSFGLSIDGFGPTNDSIRGKGAFKSVVRASEYLAENRCLYGAVVTLRPENAVEATTDKFLGFLINQGFSFLAYSLSQQELKSHFIRLSGSPNSKLIYTYCSSLGPITDLSLQWYNRIIYVAKDGSLLNDRKRRLKLSDLDDPIEKYTSRPEWQNRFD